MRMKCKYCNAMQVVQHERWDAALGAFAKKTYQECHGCKTPFVIEDLDKACVAHPVHGSDYPMCESYSNTVSWWSDNIDDYHDERDVNIFELCDQIGKRFGKTANEVLEDLDILSFSNGAYQPVSDGCFIFYHATSFDNLHSILTQGVKLRNCEKLTYMCTSKNDCLKFAKIRGVRHVVVLELVVPEADVVETFDHSEAFFKCRCWGCTKDLPPEAIRSCWEYTL